MHFVAPGAGATREGEWTKGGRSRLLQIDEVGQMISYDGRKLKHVYALVGDDVKTVEHVNRTSFSFMPCADVDGYMYASQTIFAGAGFHEGILPEAAPDRGTEGWDFHESVFSKNGMVSITWKGMQTDKSLADRYKLLHIELRAREVHETPLTPPPRPHTTLVATVALFRAARLSACRLHAL